MIPVSLKPVRYTSRYGPLKIQSYLEIDNYVFAVTHIAWTSTGLCCDNVRYSKKCYFQMGYRFLRGPYLDVYRTVFNEEEDSEYAIPERDMIPGSFESWDWGLSNDPGTIKNGSVYIKIWAPENIAPSGNLQFFAVTHISFFKGPVSWCIPNRFSWYRGRLKTENEGFQTTPVPSKTVRYTSTY